MSWEDKQAALGDAVLEAFGEAIQFGSVSTFSRNTTTGVRSVVSGLTDVAQAHVSPERTEFEGEAMRRVVTVKVRKSDLGAYTPKRDDTIALADGRRYRVSAIELTLGQQFYAIEAFKVA